MDPNILKTLHIASAFALFSALGAIITGSSSCKKCASMLHGISLLLILLIGFAMLKKPPMDQHWWQVKLLMWLFLGLAPVLSKRNILPKSVVFCLCIAAAGVASWMGLAKPF
jgi:asparagine N-glycosylation enzyme membrane subunit Stt3